MKQISVIASFTVFALSLFLTSSTIGQNKFNSARAVRVAAASGESSAPAPEVGTLLIDDFNLAPGTLLTASGWLAHSAGGTNPIVVTSPGLTFANYPSSGIGNAVTLATSGEDVHRTFAAQSSGSVYAAFLVNLTDASADATGGYFIHLGPDPISTTFRARVYARKDGSNNVSFGITKAGAALPTDVAFTGFTFSLNTTYLFVIKYTIVAGTANDAVQLFINPALPGTEPASATLTAPDTAGGDINPGSIALRQGSAATSPTPRLDGIRVGTNWEAVTSAFISKAPNDMDGDGRTDYVVLRDSNGATAEGFIDWYVQRNASGASYQVQWGIYDPNTEDLAPADYDGDGKTDIAVYRRGATLSTFYLILSGNNTIWTDQLGLATDDPVPGDYNADGKADLAVVRQNGNGTSGWHYRPDFFSEYVTINLNASGTRAGGDYNGDGFYDPAVFYDAGGGAGRFTMLLSGGGGTVNMDLGTSTDMVAPGDYDGDGKTDPAVIRNVGGFWQWTYKRSIDAADVVDTWGIAPTDMPTPGDYNGDGKWDYAIWRPNAQGEFFVMTPVTRVIFSRQWGLAGDFPLANGTHVSNN